MWHAWERREKCTGFWWDSPTECDISTVRVVEGRLESVLMFGRLADGGGRGVDSVGSG
jgi:hypothetical protein